MNTIVSRHLLVPLTDSEHAWPALEHALKFFPSATITVLTVLNPIEAGYGQRSNDQSSGESATAEGQAEQLFEAATEQAEEYGTTINTAIAEGQPAQSIIEFAEEHDVDQIILGTKGHSGVSRVLLGSVAETVAQQSPVSVTIVR